MTKQEMRQMQQKLEEEATKLNQALDNDCGMYVGHGEPVNATFNATPSPNGCLARTNLRERVLNQLDRSYRESQRTERLQELYQLLEANPAIVRILDLLEDLKFERL